MGKMKVASWPDYKWFIFGAALMTSKVFWDNEGATNKQIVSSASTDGSVVTLGYTTPTGG